MKIAYLTDAIYPYTVGGSEIRIYEVARRLVKKGHEVHIFGGKFWEGEKVIDQEGIKIHGVSKFSKLYDGDGRRNTYEPIMLSLKIFSELMKDKFDIIDTQTFTFLNVYSAKFNSAIKKTHLVFTWQQYFGDYLDDHFGKFKGSIINMLERGSLKLSKNNIASSDIVKQDLINEGLPNNILTIPNGCDFNSIRDAKRFDDRFDIIFIGRLHYQKNPELLIEAIEILKKDFEEIRVCLIGDGPKKDKLNELVKEKKLEENIFFKGEIVDRGTIYRYLKSSKVFVLPSRFEGFPLTVLEANAAGLPIITVDSRFNRTTDFISENGFVARNDAQSLADKIKYLLTNDELRKEMGNNGIEIAKNYDWNKIADDTEDYYKSIIEVTN